MCEVQSTLLNLHLKRLEVLNGYSSISMAFTAINPHLHTQYKINTTEENCTDLLTRPKPQNR